MQIYALFDDNGLPRGFFTPVIHSEIPSDAVQISVKQWHEFIRNKGRMRWDGEKAVEYLPPDSAGRGISSRFGQLLRPLRMLRRKSGMLAL